MSWFRDAIANGLAGIREAAGEPVVYATGATTISIDNAVRGAGEQVEDEQDRITVQSDDLDWLIGRDDLVSGETAITPQPGHTITFSDGDNDVTCVAVARENNQCWEWSDAGHTQYRIHTKKVKTA